MSISQNYPTIAPSLDLSFALTKKLDPRITFARASTATYYDGKTVAKAEENLLLRSQEFDVTWGVSRGVITANSTTAPDGTTTAETFSQSSGETTSAELLQTVTSVVAEYVYSVFAEADTKSKIYLSEGLVGPDLRRTWFDLAAGTVGTTSASHTAAIEDVGDGWYRCQIKFTAAARTASLRFGLADTDNSTTVTDSGGIFLWGAQLEARSAPTAYTVTTTQPITNYIPTLLTAPANVARFDHNPVTNESLGLLIEEQRTNLLTYSENFSNAVWLKSNATVTSNTIVAPDGTLTGNKLIESTALSTKFIYENVAVSAGAYTMSAYVKYGGRQNLLISFDGTAINGVLFDLINESLLIGANVTTASITAVGNSWFRVTATKTVGASTINAFVGLSNTATSFASYTGDGYSGIYIWGAQLEAGGFSTSYVKTVASQVTRASDSASMTGSNFSEWYRQDEGSFYAEASWLSRTQVNQPTFSLDTASNNSNWFGVGYGVGGYTNAISAYGQNGVLLQNSSSVTLNNTFYKFAITLKTNDVALTTNSSVISTDTSGYIGNVDRFKIGTYISGSMSGHIKKISYYPTRLSNLQLQSLTS